MLIATRAVPLQSIDDAAPARPAPALLRRALVIANDHGLRVRLALSLEVRGFTVTSAVTDVADEEIARRSFDLIFLDLAIGKPTTLQLITRGADHSPRAGIVVLGGAACTDDVEEALNHGASDYLPMTFAPLDVQMVIRRHEDRRRALRNTPPSSHQPGFQSTNARMLEAIALARQVAGTTVNVLISGEPGTGKEAFARAVHEWSRRAEHPAATVNCETTDADALEAQLFGATGSAPSRLAQSESGTLVLDEIGLAPPSLQPKLARLLVEREYERVGDARPRRCDVRFIATTSQDLAEGVKRRRVRHELALALDVVCIELPPLRDRPEDIEPLAVEWSSHFARQIHRPIAGLTPEAMNALRQYAWPGNLRELRNVIERAVLLCPGGQIALEHLPPNLVRTPGGSSIGDLVPLETIEDLHVRSVLASVGTIKGAAAVLDINPSTIARRLKR
jgi:NtrC-family two-component system response regulator AlgB